MFSPVHVPVGMLLAHSLPGGPVTAFAAGVASHLLLDAVPHGDAGIGHWVASAPTRKIRLERILSMSAADQILTSAFFSLSFGLLSLAMMPCLNSWPEPQARYSPITSPEFGTFYPAPPRGWKNSTTCTSIATSGAGNLSPSSPA